MVVVVGVLDGGPVFTWSESLWTLGQSKIPILWWIQRGRPGPIWANLPQSIPGSWPRQTRKLPQTMRGVDLHVQK